MNSSLAKAAPLFSFTRPLVYEAFKKNRFMVKTLTSSLAGLG